MRWLCPLARVGSNRKVGSCGCIGYWQIRSRNWAWSVAFTRLEGKNRPWGHSVSSTLRLAISSSGRAKSSEALNAGSAAHSFNTAPCYLTKVSIHPPCQEYRSLVNAGLRQARSRLPYRPNSLDTPDIIWSRISVPFWNRGEWRSWLPANIAKTGGIERDNPAQHKSWRWFIFRRWALFGNVWSRRSFSLL